MYDKTNGTVTKLGRVLGLSTVVAGSATLPNTGGNTTLKVLSLVTISVGVLVVISFIVTKLLTKRSY